MAKSARQRRAQAAGEPPSRSARLWSFSEGLRLLIETLRNRLARPPLVGVTVRTVRRQEPANGDAPSWSVLGEGNDRWPADAVVLACPAYQQAAMLADTDPELADQVGGIAYNRVAVVAVGYRRSDVGGPLDGFGYIAPQGGRRDVLGVQWCSSIFPDRAPRGMVLLRAMAGGWHRAEVAGWEDARLLAAVRADLRQAMGIQAAPVFQDIVRWDRAIPQYHLGHGERVAWIERRLERYPGLFAGGNAYHGVALNDCTERAGTLAGKVHSYLAGRIPPGWAGDKEGT
jgi:oxygen-dependent protoporphyrinogen oxidase